MTVVATRGNLKLVDDGGGLGHIEGTEEQKPLDSFLKWGYWKPVGETASGFLTPEEEELARKYEVVLERNAKRCKRNYLASSQVTTAAGEPKKNTNPQLDETLDEKALSDSAKAAAKRLQAKIARDAALAQALEFAISFAVVNPYLEGLVERQAGRQAERITAGVREVVARVIGTSLEEGWTVPETADAIYVHLRDAKRWQATMLARTDLIAMSNGGSFASAQALLETAPVYKRWINADDEKVRPTHVAAQGQVRPLTSPFVVGDASLMYPGDPAGPDGEVINCRCTLVYTDDPKAVISSAWDEWEHPRHPAGSERGGEFAPKDRIAPDAMSMDWSRKLDERREQERKELEEKMKAYYLQYADQVRTPVKVGNAANFKEELSTWYFGRTQDPEIQAILDNWGNWTPNELSRLRKELFTQLRETHPTGLLSGQYAKEIGRSLSSARNEARRMYDAIDRQYHINLMGEEWAREHYPELFEVKAKVPKVKAPNPRDQGIPEVYLSEKGTFKPGFDAKLKSDLVNSAMDVYPVREFTRATAVENIPADIKKEVADRWRSLNADEAARQGWTDDELWQLASGDPSMDTPMRNMVAPFRRIQRGVESALLHRFSPEEARRLLEERGWSKFLAQKEDKAGLSSLELGGNRWGVTQDMKGMTTADLLDQAYDRWGQTLDVKGQFYDQTKIKVAPLGGFEPKLIQQLTERGVKIYMGPGASTDLDEMQAYWDERARGWGNTYLDKVGGFYSPPNRAVIVSSNGQGGSAAVAAHEVGHAIGHVLGMDDSDRLHEWHEKLYPDLAKYMKQGGKGGRAGKQELWAEGVAVVIQNRNNAKIGFPPTTNSGPFAWGKDGTEQAQAYYRWVEQAIDRLSLDNGWQERDGARTAPSGMKWEYDAVTGISRLVKG